LLKPFVVIAFSEPIFDIGMFRNKKFENQGSLVLLIRIALDRAKEIKNIKSKQALLSAIQLLRMSSLPALKSFLQ